jgi:putative ABC transport system ATP-binding protein
MLQLEHIFKTYYVGDETVHALDDASLHVRTREFVAICGPSVPARPRLMNVMGCLDLPDSGRYFLDGVNIADCTDKELSLIRSEKIGFVFQQFNLLDSMSAWKTWNSADIYQKLSTKEP